MPNHITNELIFRDVDAAAQDAIIAKLCNANGEVDFDVLVPTPINVWLGNVGSKHEKAFGDEGCGLDWSRREWGTKWNAYGHKPMTRTDDTLTLAFDTAWSPPYRWLVAVFNSTKRSFEHNWLDEGRDRGICGKWNYAALSSSGFSDPWTEAQADDDAQRHIHKLKYGVEKFEDEDAA